MKKETETKFMHNKIALQNNNNWKSIDTKHKVREFTHVGTHKMSLNDNFVINFVTAHIAKNSLLSHLIQIIVQCVSIFRTAI